VHRIPDRRADTDLGQQYGMGRYLTEIVLQENAKSVGRTVEKCPLVTEVGVEILDVVRRGARMMLPPAHLVLDTGDLLRVMCDVEKIKIKSEKKKDLNDVEEVKKIE
jgi:Trk K+ transport system NAD-binding subunit